MYFNKIAIADHGEIACRVIRACKELDIQTLVFYTGPDEHALHVRQADQAFLVSDYGSGREIVDLAKSHGAQAVHPGYGMLSEVALFAQLCNESDLIFIGPLPSVMDEMGDKIKARAAAKKAKVPVLPGTENLAYASEDSIVSEARRIGFPVMAKAAGGGGGRAIWKIETEETLHPIVRKTRSGAEYAFGRPDLYLEKCIEHAWHVEVQVICDQHGNYFHALERDCSLQRRKQKLIEESPAARVKPKLRRKLCSWAIRLVRQIGYTNVGTVEFLVSPQGKAYFSEMNTRIQVEHGVTEMRQGIDLVKLQIAIAAGERLGEQGATRYNHTMEVRIYPESLSNGVFSPTPGIVTLQAFPQPVEYLRIDSALAVGESIEITQDSGASLLAKVIVGGSSRREAIARMINTLREFRLAGNTNREALLALLQWEVFQKGEHTIDCLDDEFALKERSAWARYFAVEVGLTQQNGHLAGAVLHEEK